LNWPIPEFSTEGIRIPPRKHQVLRSCHCGCRLPVNATVLSSSPHCTLLCVSDHSHIGDVNGTCLLRMPLGGCRRCVESRCHGLAIKLVQKWARWRTGCVAHGVRLHPPFDAENGVVVPDIGRYVPPSDVVRAAAVLVSKIYGEGGIRERGGGCGETLER